MDIGAGGEHMSAYGSSGLYSCLGLQLHARAALNQVPAVCIYVGGRGGGEGRSALHGHETKQTLVNYSADKTQNKRESGIILLGFLRHAETRVCTT